MPIAVVAEFFSKISKKALDVGKSHSYTPPHVPA